MLVRDTPAAFTSAAGVAISGTSSVRLRKETMRNEIENIVDEIKQAVSLLRRHL